MQNHRESRVSLRSLAERELGAFFQAVTDAYGSKQAMIAAEDWINEIASMDVTTEFPEREFRRVTIAAAARLADRLIAFDEHSALTQQTRIYI